MLEWIFFRALRKMPKSGGHHVNEYLFWELYNALMCLLCAEPSCVICRCGYATLHHVVDKSKEDRMESFFLSETCKYLYLVSYSLSLSILYMLHRYATMK